jgi:hypothetical protein
MDKKKKELELSSPHTKISSHNDIISQPQTHNKGGFITMPFIIGIYFIFYINPLVFIVTTLVIQSSARAK